MMLGFVVVLVIAQEITTVVLVLYCISMGIGIYICISTCTLANVFV